MTTGVALAAQYVLRHSNLATTTAFYIKPSREEAVNGMRLVEERLSKRFAGRFQLSAEATKKQLTTEKG